MKEEDARCIALALVERSGIALVGSNGEDGHPWIKAMLKMETEDLKTVWFSTNTSSKRVAQFSRDPRASVYFVDFSAWMGLMLLGEVEVLNDPQSRQRLWRDGYEQYYPLGVDDPDYTVLRFSATSANYYHQLDNLSFVP
ncbi:MAG TPA: pyridoxamine 5'-phosphate oxidase family protein [Gaiellaceae bacterium]|jgi:general stress protein 26